MSTNKILPQIIRINELVIFTSHIVCIELATEHNGIPCVKVHFTTGKKIAFYDDEAKAWDNFAEAHQVEIGGQA